MYNYSLKLKYRNESETDETFQKDFLDALNIKTFDYEIVKKSMNELYTIHKESFSNCIKLIQKNNKYPFTLSDIMAFQILFSWHNFFETHQILGKLKENTTQINPANNELLTHLQKCFE